MTMTSLLFAIITVTSSVLISGMNAQECNGYYFQEFSTYPSDSDPYFLCSRSDSTSHCASKCIANAVGCSGFVLDFTRKLCYAVTNDSVSPVSDSFHHSYIHCTTMACPTCKGYKFLPNATVESTSDTASSHQLESGWCANATRSTDANAAFTIPQIVNTTRCKIFPSNWTIVNSASWNVYYPCNTPQSLIPSSNVSLHISMSSPSLPVAPSPPLPPPSSRSYAGSPPPSYIQYDASPPLPPTGSPPPPAQLGSFCTGKSDGSHSDPLGVPDCKYFYMCGGGQVLLHDACPSPLIYGSNLLACDVPGVALCNSSVAAPPPPMLPPGLNYTTGLTLSSTKDAIRAVTQKRFSPQSRYMTFSDRKLPKSVDWRNLFGGFVRQQNSCSGCWAYATVDAIQSAQMIASGLTSGSYKDGPLSVDQLLSCSGNLSSCAGGWPEDALEYAATIGSLFLDSTWENSCSKINNAGILSSSPVLSWERIPANDPIALKKAVANQPVVVGISTQGNLRLWNSSGIYDGSYLGQDCSLQKVDHNVLIVGYGNGYWLARNSWGSQWGDNGYFKIKMTTTQSVGVCNMLAVSPVYPVVTPGSTVAEIALARRSMFEFDTYEVGSYENGLETNYRRKLVTTCNGYYFQPSMSYTYNSTAFYTCSSNDSSTLCASQCIQNAPGCINFVLDTNLNSCYAITDFISSTNATMHSYLICLDTECSYCQGYKFLPGTQLAPILGTPLTQTYNLSTCAASCLSTNCTSFNVGLSNSTCQLVYEEGIPANASIYNAYSVCELGAQPLNSSGAGLDLYCPSMAALCGGGTCLPDPSASGGYTCSCPPGMVSTVDVNALPVCVNEFPCTGSTYNPCGIGICQNVGNGSYNCICPGGFILDVNALRSKSCTSKVQYALTDVGYYMDVPSNASCDYVSSLTGLGLNTLATMNNVTNCSQYSGLQAVVGPSTDSGLDHCGMLYQMSSMYDTCASVKAMFNLTDTQFADLNPSICANSSSCVCPPRSQVCVEAGQSTAIGYPCSSYDTILQNDTCAGIMNRNNMNPFSFFMLNAGIDCDSLVTGDLVCNVPYSPSYVTAYTSKRKLLGNCACQYGCFIVKKGHSCFNLANTLYRCSVKLLQYWNGLASRGYVCSDKKLIPGKTTLCYAQFSGGC